MAGETMTSKERLLCALALDKPDRPPIAMNWSYAPVAALGGFDMYKLGTSTMDEMLDAELKVFDMYGGWDGVQSPCPIAPDLFPTLGMHVALPTPERPETQVIERENMLYEEYDLVAEMGWTEYAKQILTPRIAGWDPAKWDEAVDTEVRILNRGIREYESRGATIVFPWWPLHPFFQISLARSMTRFTEDIYYQPQKIKPALQRMTDDLIVSIIADHKTYGCPCTDIVEERAGAFFYPLRVFEEFWWPYTKQIVHALWDEGIITIFHLDTPWDKNLPRWKELPRGSCSIQLDSTSNFQAAKEILRDHVSLNGDVSATLFSLGTPEEVEDYVKHLLDTVGRDGGFILSSGCTLPGAVKPDNFRAYLNTCKTYGLMV